MGSLPLILEETNWSGGRATRRTVAAIHNGVTASDGSMEKMRGMAEPYIVGLVRWAGYRPIFWQ